MIARKIVLSYCAVAAMALPAGGVFANTSQRAQTFKLKDGAPGPVNVFLAGWIDGDSGKGRMRVDGRADDTWVAKRTK